MTRVTRGSRPSTSSGPSSSSSFTSSSPSSSPSSRGVRKTRISIEKGTIEDGRKEAADPRMIVMRLGKSVKFPDGTILTLKCPPEEQLERAREVIAQAAPRLHLPDPNSYLTMSATDREMAIREEWRTIFEFYVKHVPLEQLNLDYSLESPSSASSSSSSSNSEPPSTIQVAYSNPSSLTNDVEPSSEETRAQQQRNEEMDVQESAFLRSHRTRPSMPNNMIVNTDDNSGSLLFVKRFRFEGNMPRLSRPRLEANAVFGDFRIIDHTSAERISTNTPYEYTVLFPNEFELLMKLKARLDDADKYYFEKDIDTWKNVFIDSMGDCVQTDLGQYAYFSRACFGSLHNLAIDEPDRVQDNSVRIFRKIARFVAFAHRIGVVLVDLSLRRFVFEDKMKKAFRMRTFLDIVVLDSPDASDIMSYKFGCPAYVAPEVLSHEPHGGKMADIWSLGIILFVLTTRRFPFFDVTPRSLFSKIRRARVDLPTAFILPAQGFAPNLTARFSVRSLIFGLLQRYPAHRPTADLLITLPFVNGHQRLINSKPPVPTVNYPEMEEDDYCLHLEMDESLPFDYPFLDVFLSGGSNPYSQFASEAMRRRKLAGLA